MTNFWLPYHAAFVESAPVQGILSLLSIIVSVLAVTGIFGETALSVPFRVENPVPMQANPQGSSWIHGVLAQADAAEGAADAASAGTGEASEAKPEPTFIQRLLGNPLLLPISLFAIFYVTFIAPERRKKAEEARLMSSLTKNDRVITVGGIHGVIVSANPEKDFVTLKIDEGGNTRIKVSRAAIASVVDSKAAKKNNEKQNADNKADDSSDESSG